MVRRVRPFFLISDWLGRTSAPKSRIARAPELALSILSINYVFVGWFVRGSFMSALFFLFGQVYRIFF